MAKLEKLFSHCFIFGIACFLLLSLLTSVYAAVTANIVTAVQDSRGNLKVIAWHVDNSGNVTRKGSASAGAIGLVSVTGMSTYYFATAVQDSRRNLKIITWSIDRDGVIRRAADASAGTIGLVSATSIKLESAADIRTPRLVTAVQDSKGNLKVITWDVVDEGRRIIRRGSASAGAIGLVSISDMGFSRFATAVRDSSGNLKVIIWDVDREGNITRKADASAGAISLVSVVTLEPRYTRGDSSCIVTAVRDSSGNLKVIIWDVDSSGKVTRKADASAGAIGLLSVDTILSVRSFVTSVQDSRGNLKIIGWELDREGNISRRGEASAGPINSVSTALDLMYFVTAVQNSEGNLKVIAWREGSNRLMRYGDASAGAIGILSANSIQP